MSMNSVPNSSKSTTPNRRASDRRGAAKRQSRRASQYETVIDVKPSPVDSEPASAPMTDADRRAAANARMGYHAAGAAINNGPKFAIVA